MTTTFISDSLGSQSTATPAWRWARDFAVVGAVSSFLAPALILGGAIGLVPLVLVSLFGAASGAVLGPILRRLLTTPIGALSWPLMLLGMGAVGGMWGAGVGLFGGLVATDFMPLARGGINPVVSLFVACATLAAGAQLAWFGTAYHKAVRAQAPTWPAVLLACGTPVIGWALLVFGTGLPLGGR